MDERAEARGGSGPNVRPGFRRGALRRGLVLAAALALSACAGGPPMQGDRLTAADRGRVQFRMLDAVNALREAEGAPGLALDGALTAAAATHARDMAAQNRPWHFGSDGSSPPQRAARAGYPGAFRGEAISESFETELETLAAWVDQPGPRGVLLDPQAREMGLAWHQEPSGKLWWALLTGTTALPPVVPIPSGASGLPSGGPYLGTGGLGADDGGLTPGGVYEGGDAASSLVSSASPVEAYPVTAPVIAPVIAPAGADLGVAPSGGYGVIAPPSAWPAPTPGGAAASG